MAKQLGAITKTAQSFKLGDYAGTAVNTGIVAVTAGIEQLTTLAAYKCPCVSPAQANNCATSAQCSLLLNYWYGMSFIIVPAIGLFVFGMASNPRMWKTLTGICSKTKEIRRSSAQATSTFIGIIGQAMIAPITWVAMALLDGRYYACSVTPLPYAMNSTGSIYASCEKVAQTKVPYMSDAYSKNRSYSQLLGWILLAIFVVVGIIIYSFSQCTMPLTYYHSKYFNLYRAAEEAEFDDEMKQKAQRDAEANVRKFMEERRSKREWDKIATVYDFHRDKRHLALYSYLHEWVLNLKSKNKAHDNVVVEDKPLMGNAVEIAVEDENHSNTVEDTVL